MTSKNKAFSYNPSIEVSPGLFYCRKLNLWWKDGVTYDEGSATHNGLIGVGAELKTTIEYIKRRNK